MLSKRILLLLVAALLFCAVVAQNKQSSLSPAASPEQEKDSETLQHATEQDMKDKDEAENEERDKAEADEDGTEQAKDSDLASEASTSDPSSTPTTTTTTTAPAPAPAPTQTTTSTPSTTTTTTTTTATKAPKQQTTKWLSKAKNHKLGYVLAFPFFQPDAKGNTHVVAQVVIKKAGKLEWDRSGRGILGAIKGYDKQGKLREFKAIVRNAKTGRKIVAHWNGKAWKLGPPAPAPAIRFVQLHEEEADSTEQATEAEPTFGSAVQDEAELKAKDEANEQAKDDDTLEAKENENMAEENEQEENETETEEEQEETESDEQQQDEELKSNAF